MTCNYLFQAGSAPSQNEQISNQNPGTWEEWHSSRGRRMITHIPTGDVYAIGDDNWTIRKKMAKLGFLAPMIILARSALRLGHLLSGHWAWGQGYQAGLKSWRLERYRCKSESKEVPGRLALYLRVAAYSLFYFASGAVKLATLPIAMLLMQGAALLSIVDPLMARRYFGLVEETWAIDLGESRLNESFNYLARCMQPTRVRDQYNLFFDDRESMSCHCSYLLINQLLKDHEAYFGPLYETLSKKFSDPRIRNDKNERKLQLVFEILNDYIKLSHQIADAEGAVGSQVKESHEKALSRLLQAQFYK